MIKQKIPCTDTGNAELIVSLFGEVLRYDHCQGRWLIWERSHHRWREDKVLEVRTLAIDAARRRRFAAYFAETDQCKREFKWSLESENRRRLDAALDIAKSLSPISDPGTEWDTDPWLLGVANGVIDLHTGNLREECPGDRITKHSPVSFDPDAKCPRFERFLKEIFKNDAALIDYMQRAIGYSLTGSVQEQCVFCWYGSGANGKTTLCMVFHYIFGDYAVNLPFSALESQNRNSTDLVALAGSRFATAAETNEGVGLNEARIKVLTGGDPITARRLYHESFTFKPTHKLVLAFNHKPVIADDSEGMWRRVQLTPFERQFKPEEQDRDLADKLKAESPGILAWAVKGCLLWQTTGLGTPPAVAKATAAYREQSDHVGKFFEDCCVVRAEISVSAGDLWCRYQQWIAENEEVSLSRKTFAERLESRGLGRRRSGHGGTRIWVGIGLQENEAHSQNGDTVTTGDTISDNSPSRGGNGKVSESASAYVTTSPPLRSKHVSCSNPARSEQARSLPSP